MSGNRSTAAERHPVIEHHDQTGLPDALIRAFVTDPRPGLLITGDPLLRERLWAELTALLTEHWTLRILPRHADAATFDAPADPLALLGGHGVHVPVVTAAPEILGIPAADLLDDQVAVRAARADAILAGAPHLDAVHPALRLRCTAVLDLQQGFVSLRNLVIGLPLITSDDTVRPSLTPFKPLAIESIIALAAAHGLSSHLLDVGAAQLAHAVTRGGDDAAAVLSRHVFEPRAVAVPPAPAPTPAPESPKNPETPESREDPDDTDSSAVTDTTADAGADNDPSSGPNDAAERPDATDDDDSGKSADAASDGEGDSDGAEADPSTDAPAEEEPGTPSAPPRAVMSGRARRAPDGRRGPVITDPRRGRAGRTVDSRRPGVQVALVPTILAAAPWQRHRQAAPGRLVLTREDLRGRLHRRHAGRLTIVVVDASGSMAHDAIAKAKRLTASLLRALYQDRHLVAMVIVRGREATVGLPATRSLTRARSCLRTLPVGGGTPLASGLLLATSLAGRYDPAAVDVVVLTDGRTNVGVGGDPRDDAIRAAATLRAACAHVEVHELGSRWSSTDARWLSAACSA